MESVLTDQNFETEIGKAGPPLLVDFWAPWCGPCRVVDPIIEELAKEYEGKIRVGKLNVDENSKTAAKYNVMSIPTLLIFKKGEVVKIIIGAQSKERFKQQIEEALESSGNPKP